MEAETRTFYKFFQNEIVNFATVSMMIYGLTHMYANQHKLTASHPFYDVLTFLVGCSILLLINISIGLWGNWKLYKDPELTSEDGDIEVPLMSFICLMSISTHIIYWLGYQPAG